MKSIKFKNENGETIEVKRHAKKKGIINIRHERIHPTKFGQWHEFEVRIQEPGIAESAAEAGIDLNDPRTKKLLKEIGGYMLLHFNVNYVSPAEVAQIRAAIKQLE